MSYSSKKRQKKLSMLVGMALGAGIVFGMLPTDAAEAATWDITRNDGGYYEFKCDGAADGEPLKYGDFIKKVAEIVAKDGEVVNITGANTAQALSSEDLTLGANTVVNVKGSTNKAKIVANDTKTNLTVTTSGIEGKDVNLKSVEVSVVGGKSAVIDVTGNIDTLTVVADTASATGSLVVKQPVTVGTLTVADNTRLETEDGVTVKADTLVLDRGALVADNTSVTVNKIVVDAADDTASKQLAQLNVSALGGGSVEIEVVNATKENTQVIEEAIDKITTGGKVTVDKTVTTEIKPDYGTSVKEQVESAFENASKVVLDKDQAKKLTGVTVPAGKTLEVQDGNGGTVSATPKGSAASLNYNGSVLSAAKGTAFESVVVSTDKAVKVDIAEAVIDKAVVSNGVLDTTGNNVTINDLSVTGGDVYAGVGTINAGTATISGGAVNATKLDVDTLKVASGAKVTAASVEALEATVAGEVVGAVNAKKKADISGSVSGTVTASEVKLSGTVRGTITTDKITVDNINALTGANVVSASGGNVTLVANVASLTEEQKKTIEKAFGEGTKITVKDESGNVIQDNLEGTAGGKDPVDPKPDEPKPDEPKPDEPKPEDPEEVAKKQEAAKQQADTAIKAADEKLAVIGSVENLSAKPDDVVKIDPFKAKVPTASEISTIANVTDDQLSDVSSALTDLYTARSALATAGFGADSPEYKAVQNKIDLLENLPKDSAGMKAQAAKLTEAVQQVGKTAAAPSATSARTAGVITSVMTQNVVTRTAEIRGFASAIDEGRPAPEKVWFQYKHTNMDVDGGDVYSKSTINTNNFQLGYDTQIGTNDYLGAYIGTTTGNADFRGPARDGRVDIENAFDFGVYGTHMLPNDQYIDYMIHTGKFDSKLSDVKYGTNDTGLMVGYGLKLAQTENLTLNPYVQLAYDKVDVDSYTIAGNTVNSDKSNNWTAKLGLNLVDASGFYGGLAYSRGLSGSYNAYLNGVPMPTQDNNANVIYLSMGYRAMMSKNALLDLSMEKTFADYKGWTAAGKINFYF